MSNGVTVKMVTDLADKLDYIRIDLETLIEIKQDALTRAEIRGGSDIDELSDQLDSLTGYIVDLETLIEDMQEYT